LEGEVRLPEKRSLIRHPLDTLHGIIAEATRVYRQVRDGKLDHAEGRSLVWMLAQMRAMVETQALERLEQRLEELAPSSSEGNGRGLPSPNGQHRTSH
jgi:hypothetical protein